MKNLIGLVAGVALLICRPAPAIAQLHLATVTEMQQGNLPGKSPNDLRTAYHQMNLDYAAGDLRFGLRGEGFAASRSGRNYGHLAQRFAHYHRGRLQLEAGHFYAILGSGLLLHAYELPGVITQERGSRVSWTAFTSATAGHRPISNSFTALRSTADSPPVSKGLSAARALSGEGVSSSAPWI